MNDKNLGIESDVKVGGQSSVVSGRGSIRRRKRSECRPAAGARLLRRSNPRKPNIHPCTEGNRTLKQSRVRDHAPEKQPPLITKVRSDSKLHSLPRDKRKLVNQWLFEENLSYKKVSDRCASDLQFKISAASV